MEYSLQEACHARLLLVLTTTTTTSTNTNTPIDVYMQTRQPQLNWRRPNFHVVPKAGRKFTKWREFEQHEYTDYLLQNSTTTTTNE